MEIIPSIIAQNREQAARELQLVEDLVTWIQLDVMDGKFAASTSWNNPDEVAGFSPLAKIEAHLMVEEPETVIEKWLEVADRVIFHWEATPDPEKVIEIAALIAKTDRLGIAIKMETPTSVLDRYLDKIRLVQLMSINTIGSHGQTFDPRVVDKIRDLKNRYPKIIVQPDGGVNLDNAPSLVAAGADRLVVGSALWQAADIKETIAAFKNINGESLS